MASSSNVDKYEYPREFVLLNIVPKLSSQYNYRNWKSRMREFILNQGLIGFIYGTLASEESYRQDPMAWERSDNLVRGWILATLNEETRLRMLDGHIQTASDMWSELKKRFDSRSSWDLDEETGNRQGYNIELHKAAIDGDWEKAKGIIEANPDAVRTGITALSETVLTVAVQSTSKGRDQFVMQLLGCMTEEDVLDLVDSQGLTALHYAAIVDNLEAAKMLVEKNPKLPDTFNKREEIPLLEAAWCGHRDMVLYLMTVTGRDILHGNVVLADRVAAPLLCHLISGELYDIALTLLQVKPDLALTRMDPNPFAILAEKHSSFASGNSLLFWESLIYWGVPTSNMANPFEEEGRGRGDISVMQRFRLMIWEVAIVHVPCVKCIQQQKERQHHALELVKFLCKEVAKSNLSEIEKIFETVLHHAIQVGIPDEIVEEIAFSCPWVLFVKNHDEINFIKYAIMYRRERVFNLMHSIGAGWRLINGLDQSSNNGLHLAARLGLKQQINLKASAAGAILHMQQEMQWFKAVEQYTLPAEKERRNSDGKTPMELFSDTHQDSLKEGEQWMKHIAGSCTIVAALIAAMAFAAAITVPGGNDNVNGHPILLKENAFRVFGISDGFALLSSITSVLMFLLILNSRYAEQDFLHTLPRRLIIGLITLFISILFTMIASSAILYLVFGGNKAWVLIPIVALASIPAILFGVLQFPLLVRMIQSTYGGGFFGKRRNHLHGD